MDTVSNMTSPSDPFIEHSLRTSMFFPESRLFVAGNPKAAGTSLRWWLLEAHGVDVTERTARSLWGESAPFQTVWDGRIDLDFTWKDLSEEEQTKALTATDVLTVQPVRHPVTRTFSAWAGKYLTDEPYYNDRLPPGFDPAPDQIESAEHLTHLFTRFMQSLSEHLEHVPDWSEMDVHFWPQHRLLARTPVGPVLLLRQESMAEGLQQIMAHLRERGVGVEPMPRFNENVVPYLPTFVSPEALAAIESLYATDFTNWDYAVETPPAGKHELDLPWLNDVRGRNRRYGVIHEAAIRSRRRVAQLSEELEATRRDLRDARNRERDLRESNSWKVTQPLRWASGKRPSRGD